jgi:hypothetical protein
MTVSCDNLVCAACSGLVEQGGCSVCRAARQHLHGDRTALPASPVLLTALALLLLLVVLTH